MGRRVVGAGRKALQDSRPKPGRFCASVSTLEQRVRQRFGLAGMRHEWRLMHSGQCPDWQEVHQGVLIVIIIYHYFYYSHN